MELPFMILFYNARLKAILTPKKSYPIKNS